MTSHPNSPPPDSAGAPISTPPKAGQHIKHDGKDYTTIKEGLAHILVPFGLPTETDPQKVTAGEADRQKVFYNPIQQFNRDLSVLAIRAFGEDLIARKQSKAEKSKGRKQSRNAKRKAGEVVGPGPVEGEADAKRTKTEEASGTDEKAKDDAPSQAPTTSSNGDNTAAKAETEPVGGAAEGTDKAAEEPQQPSTRKIRFRILDALSATGLRALRYSQELPFVTAVTANDMSQEAVRSIQLNLQHNQVEKIVQANTGNAIAYMYSAAFGPDNKYDVIDLDPYGTAAPFLDSAIQALANGGLLCVTCTDAGVFNSVGYLEKTYSQYGGLPVKGPHAHEAGLRLILHSIATTAARYGIAIEPLLSLSIDFYARVWVRVKYSPADVKFLAGKTMQVYNCDSGCGAWATQYLARNIPQKSKNGQPYYKHSLAQAPSTSALCEHCGKKTHLAGPMYGGPMHNPAFIKQILSYLPSLDKNTYGTLERIEGMLYTALDETLQTGETTTITPTTTKDHESNTAPTATAPIPTLDPAATDPQPFYFTASNVSRVLRCQAPSDRELRGALRHAGYRATRSHCKPGTIKTDAPWAVVWAIMREWIRQRASIREGAVTAEKPGWLILQGMRDDGATASTVGREEKDGKDGKTGGVGGAAEGRGEDAGEDVAAATAPTAAETGEKKQAEEEKKEEEVRFVEAGGKRFQVVFDEKLGKDESEAAAKGRGKRLVRYQENPRANWGPMNRAK